MYILETSNNKNENKRQWGNHKSHHLLHLYLKTVYQ